MERVEDIAGLFPILKRHAWSFASGDHRERLQRVICTDWTALVGRPSRPTDRPRSRRLYLVSTFDELYIKNSDVRILPKTLVFRYLPKSSFG